MPNGRHLAVELPNSEVLLTKRLSLLHDSKIHRLVTNLVTSAKVSPHLLCSGKAPKSQREIGLHARKENGLSTGLLTPPGLVDSDVGLVNLHISLESLKKSSLGSLISI
uniref:Uncharacterized protein n=1 Tax=Arundo donax TaxID=35708 RepID=A0A0A8ZFY8_ARUDO